MIRLPGTSLVYENFEGNGGDAGFHPAPRQGTCPLHPNANAAVEGVRTLVPQIFAARNYPWRDCTANTCGAGRG
jgi:hypothetical protein